MIIVEDADSTKRSQQEAVGSVHPRPPPTGPSGTPGSPFLPPYHTTPLVLPSSSESPPPSYPKHVTASYWHWQQQQQQQQQHHNPAPSAPATAGTSAVPRPPSSPAKRFWKAFALALLIYLASLTLTRSIIHMANSGGGIHWDDGSVGVPKVEDGRILESIASLNWTSYETRPRWAPAFSKGAETSFVLPVASHTLYLISRGSYQSGRVEVKQATERGGDTESVRVDVRVAYHDQQALARATVCRLRKSGNRHGVGIYTPIPGWSGTRDRLYFEVVFTFPGAPSERSPLRIHEFTTYTNNFAHEIDDLWQSLLFENLDLSTSNAPIQVDSVTLTRGTLTSSNGAIAGHFNTSDALTLCTSNARIQATASLFNTHRDPTKLDMRTSNGHITSSVSLATASGSQGAFVVTSRTSNAGINLRYDDAPVGSRLVSDVRTSNGAAEVGMHPAFEGRYEVLTSNARAVVRDTRPEDPSGRGLRRVVDQRTDRGRVQGRVYWAGGDTRRGVDGVSTVHTSNAQATLDL